jgi:hypothetical protein
MILTKAGLATVAAAGAIIGVAIGLNGSTASADPAPQPPPPPPSLEAPPWAPKKPAESWHGYPMVWWDWGSGGHWGVWINGGFLPFT